MNHHAVKIKLLAHHKVHTDSAGHRRALRSHIRVFPAAIQPPDALRNPRAVQRLSDVHAYIARRFGKYSPAFRYNSHANNDGLAIYLRAFHHRRGRVLRRLCVRERHSEEQRGRDDIAQTLATIHFHASDGSDEA